REHVHLDRTVCLMPKPKMLRPKGDGDARTRYPVRHHDVDRRPARRRYDCLRSVAPAQATFEKIDLADEISDEPRLWAAIDLGGLIELDEPPPVHHRDPI